MTNSVWEVSLSLIIRPSTTHAQGCHKVTFFLNTSTSCTLFWVFSCPHFVQSFLIRFSGGNLLNKWGTNCYSFLLFLLIFFFFRPFIAMLWGQTSPIKNLQTLFGFLWNHYFIMVYQDFDHPGAATPILSTVQSKYMLIWSQYFLPKPKIIYIINLLINTLYGATVPVSNDYFLDVSESAYSHSLYD